MICLVISESRNHPHPFQERKAKIVKDRSNSSRIERETFFQEKKRRWRERERASKKEVSWNSEPWGWGARVEKKEAAKRAVDELRASAYVCAECDGRGRVDDKGNGVYWYGCDLCDNWFHNYCLSGRELCSALESVSGEGLWMCKMCAPDHYEEWMNRG